MCDSIFFFIEIPLEFYPIKHRSRAKIAQKRNLFLCISLYNKM